MHSRLLLLCVVFIFFVGAYAAAFPPLSPPRRGRSPPAPTSPRHRGGSPRSPPPDRAGGPGPPAGAPDGSERALREKYLRRSTLGQANGVLFDIKDNALTAFAKEAIRQLRNCHLTESAIHNYGLARQGEPLTGIADLKHHQIHLYPLVLQLEKACYFTFTSSGEKQRKDVKVEGNKQRITWTQLGPADESELPSPYTTPPIPCSLIQAELGQARTVDEVTRDKVIRSPTLLEDIRARLVLPPGQKEGVKINHAVTVTMEQTEQLVMNEYAQRQIPPDLWRPMTESFPWESLENVGLRPDRIPELQLTPGCKPNCIITHVQRDSMVPRPDVPLCFPEAPAAGHQTLGDLLSKRCQVEIGSKDHGEMIGFTITKHSPAEWTRKPEPAGWPFIYFSGTSRSWNSGFTNQKGFIPYQVADVIYENIIATLGRVHPEVPGSCRNFAAEQDGFNGYSLDIAQPMVPNP